jgi:hypothetical protein
VRVRRARASEGTKEDGLPRMRIAIATKLERQKPNSKIKGERNVDGCFAMEESKAFRRQVLRRPARCTCGEQARASERKKTVAHKREKPISKSKEERNVDCYGGNGVRSSASRGQFIRTASAAPCPSGAFTRSCTSSKRGNRQSSSAPSLACSA